MGAAQSLVGLNLFSIIVAICNTLIALLIIKKFLYKPIRRMMAKREEEVQNMYDTAEKSQSQAENLRDEYTSRLAKAKEEAADITKSATRRATIRSEEILKEASQQAAEMTRKAELSIEQERKKARNDIKEEITGLSVMIASKIVEKDIDEKDHERLIENFISKVG